MFLSVQLGVFVFLGYVAADLLSGRQVGPYDDYTGNSAIPDFLESLLSMTTEYVVLFSGVVGIPILVLRLRVLLLAKGFTRATGVVGERIVHLAATLAAYYLWSQLVLASTRTVFRIEAVNWPFNAASVVGEYHWLIVGLPAAAVVFRWLVEARAYTSESLGRSSSHHRPLRFACRAGDGEDMATTRTVDARRFGVSVLPDRAMVALLGNTYCALGCRSWSRTFMVHTCRPSGGSNSVARSNHSHHRHYFYNGQPSASVSGRATIGSRGFSSLDD